MGLFIGLRPTEKNPLKHSRFALYTCTSEHKFYFLISSAVDLLNMMTVVVGN